MVYFQKIKIFTFNSQNKQGERIWFKCQLFLLGNVLIVYRNSVKNVNIY